MMSSKFNISLVRKIFGGLVFAFFFPPASSGQTGLPVEGAETVRSLGIFVTLQRLTQMTDSGLQAIPQGALVSVVENPSGQKFAIFRQIRIPLANLNVLSRNDAVGV